MGMPLSRRWREARDELLVLGETQPRIAYAEFAAVCDRHGLSAVATRTLAGLMHDLGYIVVRRMAAQMIVRNVLQVEDRPVRSADLPKRETWRDNSMSEKGR
ncbi:MAG: hypothetical protein KKB13_08365, partial [Chloroflexi bacterium]|nr:hypothetical protein [Chloroflexota bacterium]